MRRSSKKTWVEWCAASAEISGRSLVAQLAYVAACMLVAGAVEAPAIKAVAVALVGAPCLVFASNGLCLMVDYRRRRRALRPYAR